MKSRDICKQHCCIDEIFSNIKDRLDIIEKIWKDFDLECQSVKTAFSMEGIDLDGFSHKIEDVFENIREYRNEDDSEKFLRAATR